MNTIDRLWLWFAICAGLVEGMGQVVFIITAGVLLIIKCWRFK